LQQYSDDVGIDGPGTEPHVVVCNGDLLMVTIFPAVVRMDVESSEVVYIGVESMKMNVSSVVQDAPQDHLRR
jgi:actin-like ATPase involved in cell morphogenesis